MGKDSDFRKPIYVSPNGLYLTTSQLQFFLNRKNGHECIKNSSPQFKDYYQKCLIYNFVWDLIETEPDVGQLCWDHKSESVILKFPCDGKMMTELSKKNLLGPIYLSGE